jgi:CD2 antigen cytoplasmic tail-binding protein 2
MSASERWRRKKDGASDSKEGNRQQVTELTELANRLLTRTGNMNIYQESYEHIAKLVGITSPLLGGRGYLCWSLFTP